jgi:hypothetical protein
MADEQLVKFWSDVPVGSKLVVIVEGTTSSEFLVALLTGFVRPPPEGEEITPAIIDTANGTPAVLDLESSSRYSLDIDLDYRTDATAKVHARIEEPDGSTFDEPLETDVARTKGKLEKVMLTIRTATSGKAKEAKKAKRAKKPKKAGRAK